MRSRSPDAGASGAERRAPHSPQYFSGPSIRAPHAGQAGASRAPHSVQKRRSARFSLAQDGHVIDSARFAQGSCSGTVAHGAVFHADRLVSQLARDRVTPGRQARSGTSTARVDGAPDVGRDPVDLALVQIDRMMPRRLFAASLRSDWWRRRRAQDEIGADTPFVGLFFLHIHHERRKVGGTKGVFALPNATLREVTRARARLGRHAAQAKNELHALLSRANVQARRAAASTTRTTSAHGSRVAKATDRLHRSPPGRGVTALRQAVAFRSSS